MCVLMFIERKTKKQFHRSFWNAIPPSPWFSLHFTDHNFFSLPIIIAFVQLLTYCTVCSAHTLAIQFAIAEMNESAHKRYSNTHTHIRTHSRSPHINMQTLNIQSKDDQITVWCAYAHFTNSIIIFIVWSLLAILCIFPIRLRCTVFFFFGARSKCIEQTDTHSYIHSFQENALFHVHTVYGIFCMWNDVCSIAMLLLLLAHLRLRVVWWWWSGLLKGEPRCKENWRRDKMKRERGEGRKMQSLSPSLKLNSI